MHPRRAVLGVAGIADTRLLSSVILALLAVLAISQLRTRNQLAGASISGASFLLKDWPAEFSERRLTATDVLYIGVSMSRTGHLGREDFRQLLERGGRLGTPGRPSARPSHRCGRAALRRRSEPWAATDPGRGLA